MTSPRTSRTVPPMSVYGEASRRWASRCLDAPRRVPGEELTYDPAAVAQVSPDSVVVATRSGQLFQVNAAPDASLSRIPVDGEIDGAIVSLEVDGPSLLVGTRYGGVHRVKAGHVAVAARVAGRVVSIRALGSGAGDRFLVLDQSRCATLFTSEGSVVNRVEWPWYPLWVEPLMRSSSPRLRLVSVDGRSAELSVHNDVVSIDEGPALAPHVRWMLFLEGESHDAVAAVGSELQFYEFARAKPLVATLPTTFPAERIWTADVFGDRLIVGRAPDGSLATIARRAGREAWRAVHEPWPKLSADAVELWIHQPAMGRKDSQAFILLRDRSAVSVGIHDHRPILKLLRGREDWSDVADDAGRYAHLTVAPRDVSDVAALQYARAGGERTVAGLLEWSEEADLEADVLVRVACRLLISAAALGRDATLSTAERLRVWLDRRLRVSASSAYERLSAFRAFLDKYFIAGDRLFRPRAHLQQMIAVNERHATADAFIMSAQLRRQGYDVLQHLEQPGVWGLATTQVGHARRIAVSGGNGDVWSLTSPTVSHSPPSFCVAARLFDPTRSSPLPLTHGSWSSPANG